MASTTLLVSKTTFGTIAPADEAFGEKMMIKFFHTLETVDRTPSAIAVYTEGVKLACEGSPIIDSLKAIEKSGTRIVLCKTCLEYYGILDKVAVGEIGGMDTIVSLMTTADTVITP